MEAVAKPSYLPRLDGLRALLISLVLVEHFIWPEHGIAASGVMLFFVISGFLISSILLSYADSLTIQDAAISFYWRRTLRLFPIYYLCIAVTAALNINGMRETWLVNALYLTNVKIALDGAWNGSAHFWSLAIEEQFYLLWFIVVMATSRRGLRSIIVLCIVTAPIFRGIMAVLGTSPFMDLLLPGMIDSLAMGALLAHGIKYPPQSPFWAWFIRLRMPLVFLSLCLSYAVQFYGNDLLSRVTSHCLVNLLALCLVALAIDGRSDWRVDWLGVKTIRHFGKISYGIYVYHFFLPTAFGPYLHPELAHRYHVTLLFRTVVLVAAAIAIAEISWHLIESPLLKLKDRVCTGSTGRQFESYHSEHRLSFNSNYSCATGNLYESMSEPRSAMGIILPRNLLFLYPPPQTYRPGVRRCA